MVALSERSRAVELAEALAHRRLRGLGSLRQEDGAGSQADGLGERGGVAPERERSTLRPREVRKVLAKMVEPERKLRPRALGRCHEAVTFGDEKHLTVRLERLRFVNTIPYQLLIGEALRHHYA